MIIDRKYLRGVSLRDTSIPRIYLRGEAGGAPISFEGYPLELDLPSARTLRTYTLFGNTSEDAKGVGDEVVNLLTTQDLIARTAQGVTISVEGESLVLNGTTTARLSAGATRNIPCVGGHKYFLYTSDRRIASPRFKKADNTTVAANTIATAPSDAIEVYFNFYDQDQTSGRVFDNYEVHFGIIDLTPTKWADITTPDDFAHRLGYADAEHLPAFPYGSSFVAPIRVGSRNLLNPSLWEIGKSYDGGSNAKRAYAYIELPAGTYTIKREVRPSTITEISLAVQSAKYGERIITWGLTNVDKQTITLEEGVNLSILVIATDTTITQGVVDSAFLQVELGDTAHAYSPYFAPTLYPSVLSSPLHKIGDIVDYKESNGKEWHGNLYGDLGDLNWSKSDYGSDNHFRFQARINGIRLPQSSAQRIELIVEEYPSNSSPIAYTDTMDKGVSLYTNSESIYLYDRERESLTAAEMKAYLTGKKYVVPAATPTEVQGEPLPRLAIPKGESIVTLDTAVEPSNITAKV